MLGAALRFIVTVGLIGVVTAVVKQFAPGTAVSIPAVAVFSPITYDTFVAFACGVRSNVASTCPVTGPGAAATATVPPRSVGSAGLDTEMGKTTPGVLGSYVVVLFVTLNRPLSPAFAACNAALKPQTPSVVVVTQSET